MDSMGKIYVGGDDDFGFLQADKNGKMRFHSLLDKVEEADRGFGQVWYTYCDGNDVYFVTAKILFRYRNGEIKTWKEQAGIFYLCFSVDDKTYVYIWKKGIFQIVGDSLTLAPNGEYFKDKSVWFSIPLADQKILIGTPYKGLFTYDLSDNMNVKGQGKVEVFKTEIDELIKDQKLYSGCRMLDDRIVLATMNSGAYVINRQGKLLRAINEGLRNNKIYQVAADMNNNLWLATNNGISRVDLCSPISYWDNISGVNYAIENIERYKDTLFFAGFGGMYYIEGNEVKTVPGLNTEVYCMLKFKVPGKPSREILLAGTIAKHIATISPSGVKTVIDSEPWCISQSVSDPHMIYIADGENLYIAAYHNQEWEVLGKVEGIHGDIRQVVEDDNGDIWLCSSLKGVIRVIPSDDILIPRDIIRYGTKNGFLSLMSIRICRMDERFIFVTQEGLFRYDDTNDRFIPDSSFGTAYCDGSRSVTIIMKDSAKRIWITGVKDNKTYLDVLKPSAEGKYTLEKTNKLSMLLPMTIYKIYCDHDTTIWIGNTEGLYRIKGTLYDTSLAYNTLIRNVISVKDTLYFGTQPFLGNAIDKGIEKAIEPLNYKSNSIKFQYAAPYFRCNEALVYQTWLEGFNETWSAWSPETEKEYLNLLEGDYIFHVRAKNIINEIGNEAVYGFIILPPWYRTNWAYILYFLLFAGFIYLVVYLNAKRLRAINTRLEGIVKGRTKEIQIQSKNLLMLNSELQKQYQELETQKDHLKEVVATKDRFFNIIAHDLRSPFNTLIGLSEVLSTGASRFSIEEISKMNDSINKSALQVFALLDNLLIWAKAQTNRIEINKQKLQVAKLINDNFNFLSIKAANKRISLKQNIENDVFVIADSNMINTVIRNLISNAIKFTPEEGEVSISTHRTDKFISILIKDNGVGISQENIAKLFRLDTQHTTIGTADEKGTGLGLLLCKEFVEKNGGTIEVESEVGKGSIFTIKLPVDNQPDND